MKERRSIDSFPKTLIYSQTKELTVALYRYLRINANRAVAVYHASLTEETKKAVYVEFCRPGSQIHCLIATVAFGLVSVLLFLKQEIVCNLSDIECI